MVMTLKDACCHRVEEQGEIDMGEMVVVELVVMPVVELLVVGVSLGNAMKKLASSMLVRMARNYLQSTISLSIARNGCQGLSCCDERALIQGFQHAYIEYRVINSKLLCNQYSCISKLSQMLLEFGYHFQF